jgi:phage terminase small subunit
MPDKELNERQRRFVEEYLVDLNAGAAYQRAGYRAKRGSADSCAWKLLRNAKIQAAIAEGRARQRQDAEVKAADVLAEQKLLAFSSLADVLDFTGDEPRLKAANEP